MRWEVLEFADTETARVTVEAMVATFGEVVAEGDRPGIRAVYRMLGDAMAGVTRLINRLGTGLGRASLGASFPPERWKDVSPDEIIRDFHNLVAIEELAIGIKQAKVPGSGSAEARRLSQEIPRSIRSLRNKVASGKAWIQKHWPEAWTDREESDFERWL